MIIQATIKASRSNAKNFKKAASIKRNAKLGVSGMISAFFYEIDELVQNGEEAKRMQSTKDEVFRMSFYDPNGLDSVKAVIDDVLKHAQIDVEGDFPDFHVFYQECR